ncbi:helix-turn-helix transcriptional regulator [Thalassotalea litorea]|uniref:helix-turn-helix transcriptional regulator n=1 Tax=Thalassotalea litorea TaxID=2020715 RepID=UPI0037369534
MNKNKNNIGELRRQRGWSQEKLASLSGLSERTIQRVEKQGRYSLSTKAALASAFGIAVSELEVAVATPAFDSQTVETDVTVNQVNENPVNDQHLTESLNRDVVYRNDWGSALGLLVLGLAIPAIILLTGTHGQWELASFALVIGLTLMLTCMNYGFKATHRLFDSTSWIVRYPSYVDDLDNLIAQGKAVNRTAYGIGFMVSLVCAITLAVHNPQVYTPLTKGLTLVVKPLVYAMLFVEFWFRPYVRKMQRMQRMQQVN